MDHHVAVIVLVLLLRALIFAYLWAVSLLPAFDSSASILLKDAWSTSLLRWDLFHFLHIAERGYVYEYEFAFFPGAPYAMRIGSQLLKQIGLDLSTGTTHESLLVGGVVFGLVANVIAAVTLYDLTLHYFPRSPNFAYLTVLLSLLSSSPATLHHTPCTEPFFTCLSYLGMLCCVKRRFTLAALVFALAGSFRSNGTLLAGFIIWGTIIEPISSISRASLTNAILLKRIFHGTFLAALVLIPFAWHQRNAYISFCSDLEDGGRPWCTERPPLVYTFVQSKYWNVGFLRYWTPQQLPNIILAVPVLLLLLHASIRNIKHTLPRLLTAVLALQSNSTENDVQANDPILSPSLLPHAIHALIMSLTLLFAAHTQIALRFASAMPFTYWAAASLFVRGRKEKYEASQKQGVSNTKQKRSARWTSSYLWTTWSLLWGVISLVAWGVFLPPA